MMNDATTQQETYKMTYDCTDSIAHAKRTLADMRDVLSDRNIAMHEFHIAHLEQCQRNHLERIAAESA